MEYWLHFVKRTDVVKASALNHLHGGLEVCRNAHSIVGIRARGNDLSSQLLIPADNIIIRQKEAQRIIYRGVDFYAVAGLDDEFE